ncbi:MAG: hypothetical protein LBP74_01515, partial [Treponema sp.]|nr:hypothetical protein [Treponema sp.]
MQAGWAGYGHLSPASSFPFVVISVPAPAIPQGKNLTQEPVLPSQEGLKSIRKILQICKSPVQQGLLFQQAG